MAPTEREENSAFYPQCREIPSSGIPLPERRDQSPFSQAGESPQRPPSPEREEPFTALLSLGRACVEHAPQRDSVREQHLPSLCPQYPSPRAHIPQIPTATCPRWKTPLDKSYRPIYSSRMLAHTVYHTPVCAGFRRPVQNTAYSSPVCLGGSQTIDSILSVALPSPFHVVGKPVWEVQPTKERREV